MQLLNVFRLADCYCVLAPKRRRGGGRGAAPSHGRQRTSENLSDNRPAAAVVNSSPVSLAFSGYKSALDSKHNKHEALVKISRDVTIESKRIIFHLHRCIG